MRSGSLNASCPLPPGAEQEDRVRFAEGGSVGGPAVVARRDRDSRHPLQPFLKLPDRRVVLVLTRTVTGLVGDQQDLLGRGLSRRVHDQSGREGTERERCADDLVHAATIYPRTVWGVKRDTGLLRKTRAGGL